MFKNRALVVKMARTDDQNQMVEQESIDLDVINGLVKEQVTHIAKTVITTYAAIVGIRTISTILVNRLS